MHVELLLIGGLLVRIIVFVSVLQLFFLVRVLVFVYVSFAVLALIFAARKGSFVLSLSSIEESDVLHLRVV